jgi:glycosyltransferase involved in cell wall biosynthesis
VSRVLFLTDRHPASGHGGGERTLSIYNALQKIAEVDLFLVPHPGARLIAKPGERLAHVLEDSRQVTSWYWRKRAYLLKDFRRDEGVYAAVGKAMDERGYDAFFGRYHLPLLAGCEEFGPSFVDADDLPMDTWSSPLPLFDSVRHLAYIRALSKHQTVFVTKQADVPRVRHRDARLLPCISTLPEQTGPIRGESVKGRMLFVGGTDWPPNGEGVRRFIEKSLPRVLARVPDAVLRVVGKKGTAVAGPAGVLAADFVPDLMPEYEQASIVVCPIYRGSGSIVKLAEAAAYGRAIVATPFAARGYEGILAAGKELVVAHSDDDFADACVKLLLDDQFRSTQAANAQRAAAEYLSQAAIDRSIGEAMKPWLESSTDRDNSMSPVSSVKT